MLSREPSAGVVGRDGRYVIKSRSSYFVADTKEKTYAVLGGTNRCIDYGEYPARYGESDTFVTFATVKAQDTGYPTSVAVRAFAL